MEIFWSLPALAPKNFPLPFFQMSAEGEGEEKKQNAIFFHAARFTPLELKIKEDKKTFKEIIEEWLRKNTDDFIFQYEKGEEGGHPHFQIYFHVKTKARSSQLCLGFASHISESVTTVPRSNQIYVAPCSTNGREALKQYCMKKETRIDGPWGFRAIYMGTDLPPKDKLYQWQKVMEEKVMAPADDRKITWIIDTVGKQGKSKFAKYMYVNHQVPTFAFANAKDVMSLIMKCKDRKAYIFDLSRTKPQGLSMDDLYYAMEQIKNGYLINTKFQCEMHAQNPANVLVFSNFPPAAEKLSDDRWEVFSLEDGQLVSSRKKRRICD